MLTALALLCAVLPPVDAELALRGLDPVALCEGAETAGRGDLAATHGRLTYRFADEDHRARFLADPERYGVQWGGNCARMGPLSGAGSPDRWAVHEGRIFLFASNGCREGFLAAPEQYIVDPPALPAFDAAARTAGAAWIERAVVAHGGAAALDAPGALQLGFEGEQDGWHHGLALLVARTGGVRRTSTWTSENPAEKVHDTAWVLGKSDFTVEDGTPYPLASPDQRHDLRRFAHREPLTLLWARGTDDFLAVHRGTGELAGVDVEDVLVQHAGILTTLHLDAADGRVRGLSWRGRIGDGRTRDVVETFTAWQEVDGVRLPTARTVAVDGEEVASLAATWTTTTLLAEAPADAFRAPKSEDDPASDR